MMSFRRLVFVLVCVSTTAASAWAADPPWRLSSADGTVTLNLGLLAQPQIETLTTADGSDTAKHFFLRRTRLIFGGKIGDRLTFFIDTDVPNLGKPNATTGRKSEDGIFLQDLVLTYTVARSFTIDGGLLIVPVGHHATQSATNLLGVDYGAFSFLHSDPTNSRNGRDYGVQARAYLLQKHLEVRAGVFSGARNAASTSPLRYVARAVWYPLEADTGFFYTGTSLGTKRVISLGASVDHQDTYTAAGVDLYVDHPLSGGSRSVTGQVNFTRYDGGAAVPQLPRQDVWFVEAGFYDKATRLGPFVQWTTRDPSAPAGTLVDEHKLVGGIAYWADGHRFNLKLGVGRVSRDGSPTRTQVILQGQVFVF